MRRGVIVSSLDTSGFSGMAQDIRTFHSQAVVPNLVLLSVAVQNEKGVMAICPVDPDVIASQWNAIDFSRHGDVPVKMGLVPDSATSAVVQELVRESDCKIVLDTPMTSSSGGKLIADDPLKVLEPLLDCSALVTPNTDEAEVLAGMKVRNPEDMEKAGQAIIDKGAGSVLVKGGHLPGNPVDVFIGRDGCKRVFPKERVEGSFRGTGCAFSSLVTCLLARGNDVEEAVEGAERTFHRGFDSNKGLYNPSSLRK